MGEHLTDGFPTDACVTNNLTNGNPTHQNSTTNLGPLDSIAVHADLPYWSEAIANQLRRFRSIKLNQATTRKMSSAGKWLSEAISEASQNNCFATLIWWLNRAI